jgi:hypothetical protein
MGRTKRAVFLVAVVILVGLFPSSPAGAQVVVQPSTAGMPGAGLWQQILGWLAQLGLWGSLGAILVGAATWGWGSMTTSYNGVGWGKRFVFGGMVGALFTGLAAIAVNLLYRAGTAG